MTESLVKDKEFVGNVAKLFGSSFIAQLIPFLILPVLTRIYSPADFGIWAYFLSLSGILSIIITGNYEFSVMIPEKDEDSVSIITGSAVIISVFILLTLTLFYFFDHIPFIDDNLSRNEIKMLIPVMAGVFAVFRILNFWNNRRNRFSTTALSNIVRSSSVNSFQLFAGIYILNNAVLLILGSITGYFAGILCQIKDLRIVFFKKKELITKERIIKNLKRYIDFPRYFMPGELMNFISSNVPVIFLTNLFNSSVAGLYSIPHKFVKTPLTMLGTSVSQVYYKRSTLPGTSKEELGKMTSDVFRKLFSLGIIPLSVIAAYGDYIFGFILGSEWYQSGIYASLLAPWMLIVFAASPVSIVFATLEKQKVSLYVNGLLLIIRILSFVIGGFILKDPFTAVFLFGASGFIYWIYFSFYLIKTSGSDTDQIKIFIVKKLLYIMLPIILTRVILENAGY